MDTSFPAVSVNPVWQLAQLPEPVKSSVDILVSGSIVFAVCAGLVGDSGVSVVSSDVHAVIDAMLRTEMIINNDSTANLCPVTYFVIPSPLSSVPLITGGSFRCLDVLSCYKVSIVNLWIPILY